MHFVIFSIFMCMLISRVEGGRHGAISIHFVREPESERAPSRYGEIELCDLRLGNWIPDLDLVLLERQRKTDKIGPTGRSFA